MFHEFKSTQLNVSVYPDRRAMGEAAAENAIAAIQKALAEKDTVNIMFAAAPSQNEVLEVLAAIDGIEWDRVNAFHMDEYIGLSEDHPAGFGNFLKRAIFDKCAFRSVNLICGNGENIQQEAKRYATLLQENPLDVCLMGVGENGHLAFNEPSVADFRDPLMVKTVQLEDACRWQQVHDGCFSSLEQVPVFALTVTIPVLLSAKHIVCTVPGITKANAICAMLDGTIRESCPASALVEHPCAFMFLDTDSASML